MTASISLGRYDGGQGAVLAVGVAQVGAAVLVNGSNQITTSVGQTAVVLPSLQAVGSPLMAACLTATAALLYPPLGGSINGGTVNTSVSIAAQKVAVCFANLNGIDYTVAVGA